MKTLLAPCNAPISDDFQAHKRRKSLEPGTDWACAYGTRLVAAGDGVIVDADNSNYGAEGRRLSIALDDGREVSYIHLSRLLVTAGRVVRGQVIALSGASGYGDDWYYGPHVHVSLWPAQGMAYRDSIDIEPFLGEPIIDKEDEDMEFINIQGQAGSHSAGTFGFYRGNKDGVLYALRLTTDTLTAGLPTLPKEALGKLRKAVAFIGL